MKISKSNIAEKSGKSAAAAGETNAAGETGKWRFFMDRGGTFTDIVALSPAGALLTDKIPSNNAAGGLQVARRMLSLPANAPLPAARVDSVRIGTTIATNMLLEKRGERVALLVTRGFRDILRIGDQTRPALFALDARRPPPLYNRVAEADERVGADGKVITPLNTAALKQTLVALKRRHNAIAIAFMHAIRRPAHELQAAKLARACGFARVVMSHEASALMKYIPRAHTAVTDAYLARGVRDYADAISRQCERGVEVLFMQSSGALAEAKSLRAINMILSGPAGGAVGMKKSAARAGFARAIGFDMGGTSTDVCITGDGADDALRLEHTTAGAPLFVPMLDINTVAAGGGSVAHYSDGRLQVGPHSAGANPGPACYRNGGPLTITDCNVLLGKLPVDFFPAVFGKRGNQRPDAQATRRKFAALSRRVGAPPRRLAQAFIHIATEQMAGAIRKLALARAINISDYALNAFGGAAGQHVCLVADAVGIKTALVTRQASVLSAWGIGVADIGAVKNRSVECPLDSPQLPGVFAELERAALAQLPKVTNAANKAIKIERLLRCRYEGVDSTITIRWQPNAAARIRREFHTRHRAGYGYATKGKRVLAAVAEARCALAQDAPPVSSTARGNSRRAGDAAAAARDSREVWFSDAPNTPRQTTFYDWDALPENAAIDGPAVIYNALNTIVVEPDWRAKTLAGGDLLLQKRAGGKVKTRGGRRASASATTPAMTDAAMIEIMNSRFSLAAQQMGAMLRQTAMSVNIRERLDFSCAVFDGRGDLVANAPHIPVHLGSMSDSARHLHRAQPPGLARGDMFMLNSPYHGGTHLPDITVIAPGWLAQNSAGGKPDFYVAARGHHADIGGATPGSMPAASKTIEEEGVLFELTPLVANGAFQEAAIRKLLARATYPARSPDENIADLRAQVAALANGIAEMRRGAAEFGAAAMRRGLRAVQDNAEQSARRALAGLRNGAARVCFDDGGVIKVAVNITRATGDALFDFTGTSAQHARNFNAPAAVTRAAVIYCLRLLTGENIPLNDGLLRPVRLLLPRASLLNPRPPAAVAAGNVEVSQHIADAALSALGVCAHAQGTCNNLTIGIGGRQYYETICGGMGASENAPGADATQVHMTNSRATDPEVLEWNYPLRLETFALRRGSGGAGKNAGGCGAQRRIRLLADGEVNFLTSRRVVSPQGLAGGGAGRCGKNTVQRAGGGEEDVGGCAGVKLAAGDSIIIKTPGGGGWGTVN